MFPFLENDKVWVPIRAEADDGTLGDGWVKLKPGEAGYPEVLAWIAMQLKRSRNAS
jgi:hypothetical protein